MRLGRAGAVRLPERQRLNRERRGNRVHVRKARAAQAAESVPAVDARIAVGGLESGQPLRFEVGGGAIERRHACPVGVQTDAQQLGVHVGALELRREAP